MGSLSDRRLLVNNLLDLALYAGNRVVSAVGMKPTVLARDLEPHFPSAPDRGHGSHLMALAMKIERIADHHQAREALALSVAGVTAIVVIESLILLILY